MTEKYELVRTKLENKVFTPYGQTATLKSQNSPTYNTRGEVTEESWTETSITIVPYNQVAFRLNHQPFGELEEGEQDAAVKYDVTVTKGDVINWNSEDWIITEIEKSYLSELVVTIVRMARKHS